MSADLQGRVAVVTGGANGIGAAIAAGLRECGAQVVVGDRSEPATKLDEVNYLSLDVTSEGSWSAFQDKTVRECKSVDILVNNAGCGVRKDLFETTTQEWDLIFRTNLWAPWFAMKLFSELLTKSSSGAVINIGSIYGRRPPPEAPSPPVSPAYQASKAGLSMLMRSAAHEFARRQIRVNTVLPGVFKTDLIKDLTEDQLRPRISGASLGRAGELHEVSDVVCFLASDEASFIHGAEIAVDGGFLAG